MIASLSRDMSAYMYDVFVAKFDLWFAFGLGAQIVFTARFVVQWITSEREGRSVIPVAFWILSVTGGLMTLIYGIVRREPIIILGQALSIVIYARNLMLIAGGGRRVPPAAAPPTRDRAISDRAQPTMADQLD